MRTYVTSGCLREVRKKNKKKLQTVISKSGRGRLRSLTKGSNFGDLAGEILVFWKTGRSREVVAYER